jgi:hypothetical protein
MKGRSREFIVAYTAAFKLIEKLDEVVPSDELKIWLGAMQLNTDLLPVDAAIESYFEEAFEFAKAFAENKKIQLDLG